MKQLSLFDWAQIPVRASPKLEIGTYIEDTHAARRGRILRTKDLYVGAICLLNQSTATRTWSKVVKITQITDREIHMSDGRPLASGDFMFTRPEYVDDIIKDQTIQSREGTLFEAIPNEN